MTNNFGTIFAYYHKWVRISLIRSFYDNVLSMFIYYRMDEETSPELFSRHINELIKNKEKSVRKENRN